jgi:diaminohydroxyphosphoribosylaminopyrimidine deaminase/5-amino-6-(5-phosphoribosylamino)uracil reductase
LDIHQFLLEKHNNIFHEISLYTTLEPCSHTGKTPSCARLIESLRIKRIYVGSSDNNEIASGGNDLLQKCGVSIQTLLQKECDALLEPFNKWREKNFVFFKWAQRLNGTHDGGVVSSLDSRKNVHAMRDVCDLLVIGGNTVRIDRPTLDARLVNGKAPDVLIYSKQNDFDSTIPLFSVANRKVYIEGDFSRLAQYKNIMIEGGAEMFKATQAIVDFYLCYIAPKFGGKTAFDTVEDKFEILNLQQESQDIMLWLKREK